MKIIKSNYQNHIFNKSLIDNKKKTLRFSSKLSYVLLISKRSNRPFS